MDALTPDERRNVERIKLLPLRDIDRADRVLLLDIIHRLAPPPLKTSKQT